MDKKKLKPLKELLDSVRDIDGFPIGTDEDILKLSDPPYYTACPNPYINDFIEEYGNPYDPETDDYERKPFVGDVKEAKNDSFSLMHEYVTKVPYKAIMYSIFHYTNHGDIILDGFSGSGMTGLASQMCFSPEKKLKEKIRHRLENIELGTRKVILNDLSPTACFISYTHNYGIGSLKYNSLVEKILENVEEECGWLFRTNHEQEIEKNIFNNSDGEINNIIWSDNYLCPYCNSEFSLWDIAIDSEKGKMIEEFECLECKAKLNKKQCKRFFEEYYDDILGMISKRVKKTPIYIDYKFNGKKYKKKPGIKDLELIEKIEKISIPYWIPVEELPKGYNTNQPKNSHNLTHIHKFYSKRNLYTLSKIYDEINKIENKSIKLKILSIFTSLLLRSSEKCVLGVGYFFNGGGGYASTISGNLYIPALRVETSVIQNFKRRLKKMNSLNDINFIDKENLRVSNGSITNLKNISSNAIDYIFTDPPFGENLMYSELNFLVDAWLNVKENIKKEAIMNKVQEKGLYEYIELMSQAFKEYFRVLKPNRWITVVFHNSKASVWNGIQKSINNAGFIISQVAVLDKKTGSFISNTSSGAVKNDLVINAYKPKDEFKNRFLKTAGEGMEIDFVKERFNHLSIEPNIERTKQMLYSKMLAYYIEQGFKIKYNANNFYELLEENFAEIDGYWFDDTEVNQYNERKSKQGNLDKVKNLSSGMSVLFITDEKSALQWIYSFLSEPKDYSEIFTSYQKVTIANNDDVPELKELLDNNFFTTDGKYRRPDTKQERKELRKNREKELERSWKKFFDKVKNEKGKRKNVRREVLMYGLKKCYDEEKYNEIILVSEKLHASIYEEDSSIMDFIDAAKLKSDDNKEGSLF